MKRLSLVLFFLIMIGCQSVKIEPVTYDWPLENVLKIQSDFTIVSPRYSIKMNLKAILEKEKLIKNNSSLVDEVRIIRNLEGYYFLTGHKFKNVYVLKSKISSMVVENEIHISDFGIVNPALNQRGTYIELLIDNEKSIKLRKDGKI